MRNSFSDLEVIIITENRLDRTLSCLRSLRRAAKDFPISILFGFNGSPHSVSEQIIFEIEKLQFPAGHQFVEFTKRLPGAARNEVIKISKCPWVFFADDDITVPENIFENFYTLLQKNPDVNAFGGPNLNPLDSSQIEKAQGIALASPFVSGPLHKRYKMSGLARVHNCANLTLCNLFWKKQENVFFPEDYVCGEELSLIRQTQHPFIRSDSLFVYHYRRSCWRDFFRQTFKYGLGRAYENPFLGLSLLLLLLFFLKSLKFSIFLILFAAYFSSLLSYFTLITFKEKESLSLVPDLLIASIITHGGYVFGFFWGSVKKISDKSFKRISSPS